MKRNIFTVCVILIVLIIVFSCYKFWNFGNTKNIENINEFDEFLQSIDNFKLEAFVTVNSNKNSNTYRLEQECKDGVSIQKINSDDDIGVVIENYPDRVVVKNTLLTCDRAFDMYRESFQNSIGLDEFLLDYRDDDKKELVEKDGYYIASIKVRNSQNKYCKSKTLYFDKEKNRIEKIEVKDINNNQRIIIEYTMIQIL